MLFIYFVLYDFCVCTNTCHGYCIVNFDETGQSQPDYKGKDDLYLDRKKEFTQ